MIYIDLMLKDVELMNTLQFGIKGEHYELLDEETGVIGLPNGLTAESSGYYGLPGVYGDKNHIYTMKGETQSLADAVEQKKQTVAIDTKMSEDALKNSSKGVGFVYDNKKQAARIAGLDSLVSQYVGILSVGKGNKGSDGTYTGPGSTYAEFIEKLEKAKINLVIADKNEQFQNWLAKQN